MKYRMVIIFALVLFASHSAFAADQPQRTHLITPEDYFSLATITSVAVSPGGNLVAYTEQRWEPPEATRNADLWVVDAETGRNLRLTFDRAWESGPRWSADGRFIYYTAGYHRAGEENPPYDGSTQVWRIAPTGGDPQAVTRVRGGIGHFDLAGNAVYYTTSESTVGDEWSDLRARFPDLEYGHGVTPFDAVWKLDLQSWRAETVVEPTRVIHGLDVSSDGKIAMVTTSDDEQIHVEGWSEVWVADPETGQTLTVTPPSWRHMHLSPYGWLNDLEWSADGRALAYSVDFDGFPTVLYVAEWEDGEPYVSQIEKPGRISAKGGIVKWRGSGRDLAFLGEEKARSRVYILEDLEDGVPGGTSVVSPGDLAVDAFGFDSKGGTPTIVTSTLTNPPDIYTVDAKGKLNRLTKVNPQVDTWILPTIEVVSWTSADGTPVDGILELPAGYEPSDGALPLVVEIHGGPTSASRFEMRFWIYGRTLMAANGYALLSPNYRGSTGYGEEFMTDLIGHENDRDVADIMSGVDALIERGIADPDRLAVMGWSNGGFLANCLITTTDRFKAASSGAGVLDQNMQWATQDTPGHNINFMDAALPWQNSKAYAEASPLHGLGRVATPTLIHVGGNDPRVLRCTPGPSTGR